MTGTGHRTAPERAPTPLAVPDTADPAPATAPSGPWRDPLRSLRHPGYRLLVAGQLTTSSAQWMEQVARGWLVYDLTGSALLLGLVQAARALPLLVLGVLGGVAADRFDRKRQLILAQNANMALNVVLAVLILTGWVQTWHVFATAILAGSVMAFQQPARQSLIPELAGRNDLMNAVALNSAILNVTRTLGPTVAGFLIAWLSTGGAYLVQAGLFLAASLWTAQLPVSDRDRRAELPRTSMLDSLLDGFRYVRSNGTILALLLVSLIPIVLAQPYQALVPIFAKDIFEIGPGGLGLLLSAPGLGALASALVIAWWSSMPGKGAVLLGGVVCFGAGLVAFALSPSLPLALVALLVVGAASTSYRAINQTLLQTHTEDSFRGRVMSIYLLDRGVAPLGSAFAGAAAYLLGPRAGVEVLGGLTVAFALLVAVLAPRLRLLD